MSTLPPADTTPYQPQATEQLPPAQPDLPAAFDEHGTPAAQEYAGAPYAYPAQESQMYAPAAQPVQRTTVKDTNTYALVAVILTFIVPLAGIIFGHLGLNQIKRTGDAGRGLALTGLIYGYCMFLLGTLFVVLYVGFIAVMIGAAASGDTYPL